VKDQKVLTGSWERGAKGISVKYRGGGPSRGGIAFWVKKRGRKKQKKEGNLI